jgi:hypothetical protein
VHYVSNLIQDLAWTSDPKRRLPAIHRGVRVRTEAWDRLGFEQQQLKDPARQLAAGHVLAFRVGKSLACEVDRVDQRAVASDVDD